MTDPSGNTRSKVQEKAALSGTGHPAISETGFTAEWSAEQALANAMIDGYEPSPEFLEDSRLLRSGLITSDELMQRIRDRALAKQLQNTQADKP